MRGLVFVLLGLWLVFFYVLGDVEEVFSKVQHGVDVDP